MLTTIIQCSSWFRVMDVFLDGSDHYLEPKCWSRPYSRYVHNWATVSAQLGKNIAKESAAHNEAYIL